MADRCAERLDETARAGHAPYFLAPFSGYFRRAPARHAYGIQHAARLGVRKRCLLRLPRLIVKATQFSSRGRAHICFCHHAAVLVPLYSRISLRQAFPGRDEHDDAKPSAYINIYKRRAFATSCTPFSFSPRFFTFISHASSRRGRRKPPTLTFDASPHMS